MVPILSYLLYRGRSRCCNTPLPLRYPIVETIAGLLFIWWLAVGFWFFQLVNAPLSVIQPLFWLLCGIVLLIIAIADLYYGVILMNVVWFGSIVVVLYRLTLWQFGAFQTIDLRNTVIVSVALYGFFWTLYKLTRGRGMAEGDMYVALYMGLLLGWPKGLVAVLLSFVFGATISIGLIIAKIKSRKDTIPFAPFMVLASIVALVWGSQIWRWVYPV
jgi:leader peptidase (prepilin peptidase)/N-methyltransferase